MGVGFHPVLLPSSEFFGHDTVILLRLLNSSDTETMKLYASMKGLSSEEAKTYLLKNSLSKASEWLRRNLGKNPRRWVYGRIHKAVFPHALSLEPMMAPIFDAPSFPISGNTDTPYQTAFHANDPFDNNAWSISFRILSRGSDLTKSEFTATLGQSENIASRHFSDIVEDWSNGRYHRYGWKKHDFPEILQLDPLN